MTFSLKHSVSVVCDLEIIDQENNEKVDVRERGALIFYWKWNELKMISSIVCNIVFVESFSLFNLFQVNLSNVSSSKVW